MKHNMGKSERLFRFLLGIGLLIVGWVYLGGFGMMVASSIFIVVGAALVITGVFSYCPVNALIHHNSCNSCRHGMTDKHLPV